MEKKAERRLRLTGKIDFKLLEDIDSLLIDSPFLLKEMRITKSEAIVTGPHNMKEPLEKIFLQYPEKVEISPVINKKFFALMAGAKTRIVGKIQEDTIRNLLQETPYKLSEFTILESEVDIDVKTGIPVDNPQFELIKLMSEQRYKIEVISDKAYAEKWKTIISEKLDTVRKLKDNPKKMIKKVTDTFYSLEAGIDYGKV